MVKYSRGGETFLIEYKMELVAINEGTNFTLNGRTTTTLRQGAESRDFSIRGFDESLDYDCCGLKWHFSALWLSVGVIIDLPHAPESVDLM